MPELRPSLRASLNKLFRRSSSGIGSPSSHFRSVLAAFVGLGFHVGVWAVLLADLTDALALSPGSLGFALSAMTATGIAALLAAGRLADRFGRRSFLLVGAAGTASFFLLLIAVASYGGYTALLVVFAFGGICASFWDLAVNALGGDHERQYESRVMTPLHAGFSAGAASGALLSGAALASGVDFRSVYASTGAALLVLAAVLARAPLPRRQSEDPPPRAAEGILGQHGERKPRVRPRSLLLIPAVAACTLMIFMSFSTDAALEGFLSIYLRDILSSGALLGGAGLSALYLAATVGRLASGAVLSRVGERTVLTLSGLAAASGLAAVVLAESPAVAAASLLVVGVAAAPIAPVVFSLTARAVPSASGRAISLVTISGYVAFTVSPLLVGVLADLFSLRTSLLLPVAFCLGVAAIARVVRPPTVPGSPGSRADAEGYEGKG